MTKKTILSTLLILISTLSFSQNWVYVSTATDGSKYYIRNSSTDEFGNKKVWSKIISKTMTYTKKGKTYSLPNGYVIYLDAYDCDGKKSKLISGVYYNSKGTVAHSFSIEDYEQEWKDVVPDSIGEALLDKVCELF
jgi:hypothetical protein